MTKEIAKKNMLSIVLPCFNEEETIVWTYGVLTDLCTQWVQKKLIGEYEFVFVNDGSKDNTLKELLELYQKDTHVHVVDLRKNVGFQGAISAGLFSAVGDLIVTIDADLQDDPKKIEEMIGKYNEGFEMVLGVRENRKSDTLEKRMFAQTFYKLLGKIGVVSVYNHADFRLLSRGLVEELKKFPERVRYLRSLIFEIEPKYAVVTYARTPRKLGTSKFTFSKSLSFAIDGITSFTSRPIRLLSLLGIFMFIISILSTIVVLWAKFYLEAGVPGWASLAIVVLFFGGIQNLSLGIVGEYVSKIYIESKRRPMYLVRNEYLHNHK